MASVRSNRVRGPGFDLRMTRVAQPFDEHEQHRDDEDRNGRRRQHAGDDGGPQDPPRNRAGARGDPERQETEDERERSHEHRPEAKPCSLQGGVHERSALFQLSLGELDDEDRVLRRKTDEHDEPDLAVHVQVVLSQKQSSESAEHGDWKRKQHAERQRPALVQSGENEEHEHQREHEGLRAGASRLLLLEREVRPLEAHLARQDLVGHLFERSLHLIRAVAGCGSSDQMGTAEQVEAIRELGTVDALGGNEGGERDHLAVGVADVVAGDVVRALALIALRL